VPPRDARRLVILGGTDGLAMALQRACDARGLAYVRGSSAQAQPTPQIPRAADDSHVWAIVDVTGIAPAEEASLDIRANVILDEVIDSWHANSGAVVTTYARSA
jgi:hypothetical protein